jgi:uncharacterized protein (TIGR00266 family)
MAFCTNCGSSLAEADRFCTRCGTPQAIGTPPPFTPPGPPPGPAAGAQTVPPPYIPPTTQYVAESLEYTIQGDNLQVARLHLKSGQEVYAEAGRMIYKTGNVYWDTRMSGESITDKLLGALKRKITGESLFLTYFRANGRGEVGFAGAYPGRIQAFDLAPGQSSLAQRDAFLVAQPSVQFNIALVRKLGAGFFGGEGFILEKFTGPGLVFVHAGGDFVEFNLAPGETIQIDTGCIVAFDESVDYDIQLAGGIKTALFGGEGLFLASMTGPGRVIVQSMTLQKMRRELALGHHGEDDHRGLRGVTDFFGTDNG